jgi:hypothetical protein
MSLKDLEWKLQDKKMPRQPHCRVVQCHVKFMVLEIDWQVLERVIYYL